MDKKKDEKNKDKAEGKKKTTDPQEHMEGPLSSIVQNIKEEAEENDEESKKENDEKKEKNI
jgi:hypothetical protein